MRGALPTLLRADAPVAQVKSRRAACGKVTRRAHHQKSVHPLAKKYSASVVGQISDSNPPVPPDKRGVAHVTNVAVGCGGRGCRRATNAWHARTSEIVWSWRPDAGVKLPGRLPGSDGGKRARSPGRARISRKPLRREGRRCSGSPVVLPPCFLLHGGHGCNRHPAFPAPSAS